MNVDRRGRLESDPFDHRVTKDGRVLISRGGRHVSVIAGAAASRLIVALERADDDGVQLLLAKATGHYRQSNERRGNQKRSS